MRGRGEGERQREKVIDSESESQYVCARFFVSIFVDVPFRFNLSFLHPFIGACFFHLHWVTFVNYICPGNVPKEN